MEDNLVLFKMLMKFHRSTKTNLIIVTSTHGIACSYSVATFEVNIKTTSKLIHIDLYN